VNFPPIFRKVDITIKKEVIGDWTYDYMVKNGYLKPDMKPRKENKLTQLLSTHGKVMSFSSYYLWFLIDYCHFIIDDIQSIILFSKHDAFQPFVEEMMNKRIENREIEQFYKTTMNGSYGYDGMNTEKFTRNKICNEHDAQICISHADFQGVPIKIDDDTYMVTLNPKSYQCKTPIQCAYFTLDNAKFWYLNFIYNFMHRCLDMERIHFIEGDTDSAYWAVAGHPKAGKSQQFEYVVKDQQFYDEHYAEWFPDLNQATWTWDRKHDCKGAGFIFKSLTAKKEEKKLLGLAIEKEGDNMIALCPKCYTIFDGQVKRIAGEYTSEHGKVKALKMKGVDKNKNSFTENSYFEAMKHPVQGRNIGFRVLGGKKEDDGGYGMRTVTVKKNALTGVHTKMVVDENQACLPFLRLE
jgi:hypothetical protein